MWEAFKLAIKGDELVKYIAEQVITYVETPRKVRKRLRVERRTTVPGVNLWFGMIPLAISLWIKEIRGKGKPSPAPLLDEGSDHFAE
jgi:hypothetical protein